jgi:hypothetical protein
MSGASSNTLERVLMLDLPHHETGFGADYGLHFPSMAGKSAKPPRRAGRTAAGRDRRRA